MKNNIITKLFLIAVIAVSSTVFAQAGNIGGATGLLGQSQGVLTDRTNEQNATGSCDSTCDAMGVGNAPAVAAVAAFMTQVVACGSGYSGSKTQSRTQNPDGSFTPWVDADTSLCVCSPTYSDSTQMCASPLAGTFVRRTPWVCNANVGSWGTPTTASSGCFTPCALPSPSTQYTTNACGAGYSGVYNYQRTASCPGGVGANSTAAWSGWVNTSNNCVLLKPVGACLGGTPAVSNLTFQRFVSGNVGYVATYFSLSSSVFLNGQAAYIPDAGAGSVAYYSCQNGTFVLYSIANGSPVINYYPGSSYISNNWWSDSNTSIYSPY